jgi:molecular chaperone GrpE
VTKRNQRQPTPEEPEMEVIAPAPAVSQDDPLQVRISELTGDLQRLQAEFMNYKRREDEAKSELLEMAKREVVTLLLPLLDNIERALAHKPKELKDNAWAGGVEQVGKQAAETLAKLGITRIKSVGQPFDHNLHEAISMEDGDGEHEVVIEELQPGYKMGDVVVRHAMVKVGRK